MDEEIIDVSEYNVDDISQTESFENIDIDNMLENVISPSKKESEIICMIDDSEEYEEVIIKRKAISLRRRSCKECQYCKFTCKDNISLGKHINLCYKSKLSHKRKSVQVYTDSFYKSIKKRRIDKKYAILYEIKPENIVKNIISHQLDEKGEYIFLVNWKYVDEYTWEPYENFYDIDEDEEKIITKPLMNYILDNDLDFLL